MTNWFPKCSDSRINALLLVDISAVIGVSETFISDLDLTQSPARTTMRDGNKKRNWQVFSILFHKLLGYYGKVLVGKHRQYITREIKKILINLSTTASTIMVEDKGYYDFELIKARTEANNHFVTRAKENVQYEVIAEWELLLKLINSGSI